jgi:hypothetical protein
MGTSTRPPGPRTGLVTPKCYAAALGNCDGNPTTREHYVSESLLNRLGAKFFVEGVPWLDSPRELTASTMVARVLCERHNSALWPLDTMIGNFYDVLAGAREGREVGVHLFEGEDFERWALKILLGRLASGNVRWYDGSKERPRDSAPVPTHPVWRGRYARWMWFLLRGRSRRRLGLRWSQRRDQHLSAASYSACKDLRHNRESAWVSIYNKRDRTARSCEATNLA